MAKPALPLDSRLAKLEKTGPAAAKVAALHAAAEDQGRKRLFAFGYANQRKIQSGGGGDRKPCFWRYQSTGGRNAGRLHVRLADTRRRTQELR